MAKLYFRYGAMGSSKTANALMLHYNYFEKGQKAILLKPRLDNRDGERTIRSRIGLEETCTFIEEFQEMVKKNWTQAAEQREGEEDWHELDAIIVDEAQFLTEKQVDLLSDIVDEFDIPVFCYGLRTDFRSLLFEGSRRLMEIADVIEEMPTVCWCGRRAQYNTRVCDGKKVLNGTQIMLGGNESYVSLCRKHFKLGQITAKEDE